MVRKGWNSFSGFPSLVIIENIGNLICPANGIRIHANALIASVAEEMTNHINIQIFIGI